MLKLLATGLAASFLLLPPAQAAPPAPYGVQPHQQAVQRAGITLQPTELVHEAYVRLARPGAQES